MEELETRYGGIETFEVVCDQPVTSNAVYTIIFEYITDIGINAARDIYISSVEKPDYLSITKDICNG